LAAVERDELFLPTPDRMCGWTRRTSHRQIEGQILGLPLKKARREGRTIVFVGDSGCRRAQRG
jgi:hypothetical protein